MYDRIRPSWIVRLALWQGWGTTLRVVSLIILAEVLQGVLAPRIAIAGAIPDFSLVALACIAMRTNPTLAAGAGFLSGLIEASLQNQLMGSLIVSRVLACYATAFLPMKLNPRRRLSTVLALLTLTVLTQGLLYLFAPSVFGGEFVETNLGALVYNIGVVMLAFGICQRWLPLSLMEDDRRYGTFNL